MGWLVIVITYLSNWVYFWVFFPLPRIPSCLGSLLEVDGSMVIGSMGLLFHLLITWGIPWGYNLFTNHLILSFSDIQAEKSPPLQKWMAWKMILLSFWGGLLSGVNSLLNFQGVYGEV